MNKPTTKIPHFTNEAEERAFWEGQDSSECLDWAKAHSVVLPKFGSSARPVPMIETNEK